MKKDLPTSQFRLSFGFPEQLDRELAQWLDHGHSDRIFKTAENIELLQEVSAVDLRIVKHYQAIAYVRIGALNKANHIFSQALLLGDNIALLRDACCCFYQLDEIDLWRKHYCKFASELFKHRASIQANVAWSCQLYSVSSMKRRDISKQPTNTIVVLWKNLLKRKRDILNSTHKL